MKKTTKIKNALIIPDTHAPHHDHRAFMLMLNSTSQMYPNLDEIVLLGDFGEFASVATHAKHPKLNRLLSKELKSVNALLDLVDRYFPKIKKVFIEGNHEYRVYRYLRDQSPELFDVFNLRSELLKNRSNWSWVPYGPSQKYRVLESKLWARHEPKGGGEYTAASTVKRAGASVIFGHTHRIQEFQSVDINDQNHRGINIGWLGNKDDQIFDYVKDHHQWASAFSIVTVLPNGLFFNNTSHIIDYTCMVAGEVFKG